MIRPGNYCVSLADRERIAKTLIKRAAEYAIQRGGHDHLLVSLDILLIGSAIIVKTMEQKAVADGDPDMAKTLSDSLGELLAMAQGLEGILEQLDDAPAIIVPEDRGLIQ